jgi:two-component system, sensor histidine kinase and response regulator
MADPSPAHLELQLRQQHRGARVLLAEDEPVNGEVLADLLRGAGLLVDLATDGGQVLQHLAARHYALVLMDVRMPVLDGLAASRALRSMPGGTDVPVVALTALAFRDDHAACLAAGMDAVLVKPVEPGLLFATVLYWLQAGRPAD